MNIWVLTWFKTYKITTIPLTIPVCFVVLDKLHCNKAVNVVLMKVVVTVYVTNLCFLNIFRRRWFHTKSSLTQGCVTNLCYVSILRRKWFHIKSGLTQGYVTNLCYVNILRRRWFHTKSSLLCLCGCRPAVACLQPQRHNTVMARFKRSLTVLLSLTFLVLGSSWNEHTKKSTPAVLASRLEVAVIVTVHTFYLSIHILDHGTQRFHVDSLTYSQSSWDPYSMGYLVFMCFTRICMYSRMLL